VEISPKALCKMHDFISCILAPSSDWYDDDPIDGAFLHSLTMMNVT
jgi:hypothetical protein